MSFLVRFLCLFISTSLCDMYAALWRCFLYMFTRGMREMPHGERWIWLFCSAFILLCCFLLAADLLLAFQLDRAGSDET